MRHAAVLILAFLPFAEVSAQPGGQITFIKIADTDTPIPGGTGTFGCTDCVGHAGGAWDFSPPALDGGMVAFYARGQQSQVGVYKYDGAVLSVVANADTRVLSLDMTKVIPPGGFGLPAGSTAAFDRFGETGTFSFYGPSVDGANIAFFAGNGSSQTRALIVEIGGALFATFTNGSAVPGGVGTFGPNGLTRPSLSGETVAFFSRDPFNAQGVYANFQVGVGAVVADESTSIPGGAGTFCKGGGVTAFDQVVIDGLALAFLGRCGTDVGLYYYDHASGRFEVVVDGTTVYPPADAGGVFRLDSVSLDDALVEFARSSPQTAGVYTSDRATHVGNYGPFTIVADGPSASFGGVQGASVDDGSVAFGKYTSQNIWGVYATIGGDVVKVIDSTDTLDGKALSFVRMGREGLSGNQLAFHAAFQDESQGIFIAEGPFVNQPPVADAGPDQTGVPLRQLVTLDGSGSLDPDGSLPLTYGWSFLSMPERSQATLSDPMAVDPTFLADAIGAYEIQLLVADRFGAASAPDTVHVEVVCPIITSLGDRARNEGPEARVLETVYRFRDEIMARSAAGQRYIRLFYRHAAEGSWLLLRHPSLSARTRDVLLRIQPSLAAVVEGHPPSLSAGDEEAIEQLMDAFDAHASTELKTTIAQLRAELRSGTLLSAFEATSRPSRARER